MGDSIFHHSHLHLGGRQINVPYKEEWSLSIYKKGIWHHIYNILLKKNVSCCIFRLLNCMASWFESYLFTSFQISIKSKFSNVASTNCKVTQQGFPYSVNPPTSQKFASPPPGKIPPIDFHQHHQISPNLQRLIYPFK